MTENIVKGLGCLFSFIFLMVSCAGTDLTQTQVDDAYKGKPVSDILVIAITGSNDKRAGILKHRTTPLKTRINPQAGSNKIRAKNLIPFEDDFKDF